MEKTNSYVYFALTGENFDPQIATDNIGINPTKCWSKGAKGQYIPILKNSSWELSTAKGQVYTKIENLIDEVISKLFDKIEIINELKNRYNLFSVLQFVIYVDINEEQSTPAIGYDLRTIEFLNRTQTVTDIDIYRFNSALEKKVKNDR